MAVPFGFSVGDFIAGIKLLKRGFHALSDARGAKADYLELRKTLDTLDEALDAATRLTTPENRAAVEAEVVGCKRCIKTFLSDFSKFELLRSGPANANKLTFALRKLQWSLCKNEDVQRFKEHLETHTTSLQLRFAVLNLDSQFQALKMAKQSTKNTEVLLNRVTTGLQLQDGLANEMRDAHNAQSCALADLGKHAQSSSEVVAGIPSHIGFIHQRLRIDLSSDMQQAMVSTLEETQKDKSATAKRLENLIAKSESLEAHLIEVKTMVQVQREVPAQILFGSPVVVVDPFEGHRLPFHLETITSFEALSAILMFRFKDTGGNAVDRIRRQLFDMYESSRQRRIDLNGRWSEAFEPGQYVEMSMLVPASPSLSTSRCPRCHHQDDQRHEENEKYHLSDDVPLVTTFGRSDGPVRYEESRGGKA
ncbi:hypothetical protein CC86DRAFT_404988 [Ophiobolus disseminans]|uniref:Ubiquitin-like domain-containing protein n=1 Tax=Ophiobolus disseminans TaxID=1469910 RepID=A0A6A7A5U0_9PLEO|nr:hypothetical protein CC86DRAFT_404988 [Ophiobolus disseminans]